MCSRKGLLFGKKRQAGQGAVFNASYRSNADVEVYAEIGHVPDVPITSPNYDPVYVPRSPQYDPVYVPGSPQYDRVYVPGASRGNLYVDVPTSGQAKGVANGGLGKPVLTGKKSAFDRLKAQKDKFVSYFKRQDNTLAPPVKAESRPSNASSESYDHLNSNRPHISGPILQTSTDPKHLYDHTSTASVPASNAGAGSRASEKDATSEETDIPRNPSAVDLGDQYIEFKMNPGSTDRIASFKGSHPNYRPDPPSRPAPTPVINCSVTTPPVDRPKVSNAQKPPGARTVSGSQLSPEAGPSYDYAVGSDSPKVGANLSPSLHLTEPDSDNHLEAPVLYDYAHVSDSEIEAKFNESADSFYEDVDGKKQALSIKRHQYQNLHQISEDAYLEPVEVRSQSPSPLVFEKSNGDYANTTLEPGLVPSGSGVNMTALGNEIAKISHAKKPNKNDAKGVKNAKAKKKPSVVKSDNVAAKDYGTATDVGQGGGGVRNMKKMFEERERSESDTSQKSSPRGEPPFKVGELKRQQNRLPTRKSSSDV